MKAIIKTNRGDMSFELFPQYAPKAVENFTSHAKEGYYDGLIFNIPQLCMRGSFIGDMIYLCKTYR